MQHPRYKRSIIMAKIYIAPGAYAVGDVNLGENVNTKYNEYRVSCYFFDKRTFGYTETPWQTDGFPEFIIFSSDRPGGLGGYDLYLSILKEIEVVK